MLTSPVGKGILYFLALVGALSLFSVAGGLIASRSGPYTLDSLLSQNSTYYGYANSVRYEFSIPTNAINSDHMLQNAITPEEAVDIARPALEITGYAEHNFHVCDVSLKHYENELYFYIVSFCTSGERTGFRVPVFLSGEYVQPVVSQLQGDSP